MTGTIIVAKGKSLDVRTIDFERIAGFLRKRSEISDVAKKLLQSVDEFGMDMICADELDPAEFQEFYQLFADASASFVKEQGLARFLDTVCQAAQIDERLAG